MATKPAKNPLPVIEASGFPYTNHMYNMAAISPVALASMVLTAIELMRRPPLPEAPRVEPGLKPNQPNAKMRHPVITSTISWARMTCGLPSRENFPIRGPKIMAIAKALRPPTACTTPDPAKSQYPLPRPKLTPRLASHPPPQAQFAKSGYVNAANKNDVTMNAENFQRSTAAPVGIVAPVSMNTIWNKNSTITPTSYVPLCIRKSPCCPNKPNGFPNKCTVNSELKGGVPPKLATAPTPPI